MGRKKTKNDIYKILYSYEWKVFSQIEDLMNELANIRSIRDDLFSGRISMAVSIERAYKDLESFDVLWENSK